MARYARIFEGEVVEIIDFDPEGRFTEELVKTFVKCPDEVTHGWGYDWGTRDFFEIPEDPPEEVDPEPTEIEVLQRENELLKAQNKALSERADFIEDVVAEMAIQVYQ